MGNFLIREIKSEEILSELSTIKFDSGYAPRMVDKFKYKTFKIYGLNAPQANILKQLALSVGADCATPRNTITGNIESADCILGGSVSQLEKIVVKLGLQPFKLKQLSRDIEKFLRKEEPSQVQIMGILNLTPNSFSDGGMYNKFEDAAAHLDKLIEDGADIIDIGAESTKPYSQTVPAEVQLDKILPILEYINKNNIEIPISIDTRSAEVAQKCLDAGATAINDVSGLTFDDKLVEIIADYKCPIIIQHTQGTPDIMQSNPQYENLMDEIFIDLAKKIEYAVSKGVKKENIIIDPGIGFGKKREHNFEIIRRVEELRTLECPVLLGLSRKSLLNMPDESNDIKDIYTVALNTLAIENRVDIIRIHNVKLHKQLIEMLVH